MNTSQPDLRLVEQEPEETSDANIGQTLDGRYRIERLLGKGGMGLVYAARHVILQKPLAVKVLKEEVSRDEKVMARFRREAQSASAIGSAHICDVSDFGTLPDGSTYLVMEFLDGPSLAAALEEETPMPIPRILDIVIQLCDALGAAHERGIVHRDLKPDNVHLVEQGGREDFVKVLDFGIAKVGGAAEKKLTQAGQVFGTPHYMSPEQCGGREVDHRTDIYALGVMLYEMTCGVVPFDADNLMGVLTKHVYENPIPPREFPPPVHVSPGLEAVILMSLAKQPEQRYQTMADFRADLTAVLEGTTPGAVTQSLGGVVAGTQVMGSEISGLLRSLPANPGTDSMLEEPKGKSHVVLIAAAVFAVVGLGAAAFGAAFYFGDAPAADDIVATPEVPAETPPIANGDPDTDELDGTESPDGTEDNTESPDNTEPDVTARDGVAINAEPDTPAEVVMIRLVSEPSGAEVYGADGALLGNTPFEVERPVVGADPLSITLRLAGYNERTIPLSHVSSTSLTIRLDRHRSGRRTPRRSQTQVRTPQPQIRSLGTANPQPTRRRPTGGSGEIINPW